MNNYVFYTSVKSIGNRIYVRGHYEGVPFQDVVEYKPTLYIKSKEPTQYTSLKNEYLKPVRPGTIRDTREFLKQYKDVDGFNIYGNENPVYQYIADNFPYKIEFDIRQVKTYYIDIETTSEYGGVDVESAREQILLITLMDYRTKKSITLGTRPFNKKLDKNTYIECKDESDLLEKFLTLWEKSYPEIVSGWNIEGFDIPYIIKRIERTLGENQSKRLSPWKHIRVKNQIDSRTNKSYDVYEIYGVNVIDYLLYFKKYSYITVENHKLDTVTKEVLGESKVEHDEYDTFADFYTKDWNLFVEYNIVDTQLIDKLENKLSLIQLAMTLAMDSKVNPEDTLSQGRMWDAIIYNYLLASNVIIPTKKQNDEKTEKYKGAFVKPPQLGKFKWVASFDVSSLYPSIIRSYNISPETLVSERNNLVSIDSIVDRTFKLEPEYSDYTVCANGSMYRKDRQGVLPKIMEEMFNERSVFKKKMLGAKKKIQEIDNEINQRKTGKTNSSLSDLSDAQLIQLRNETSIESSVYEIKQMAKKVSLNSAYGCMGGSFFRFYDIRNAEAITYTGQAVIKIVDKYMNQYLQKISGVNSDMVIAGDTDSVAGYSIINVNNESIRISDFFDRVEGEYIKNDTFNNNYVKKVNGYTTPSVSATGELEYKPIKYVMKHKVNKRLYKLITRYRNVVVTQDHSIIAIPKNYPSQNISVFKPSELSTSDHFLLSLSDDNTIIADIFGIEDLGVHEEWVYDIEVEDNHNFFANDICVHNSCFLHLDPIINKVFEDKQLTDKETIDFLCNICDNNLQVVIDKIFKIFTETTNAYENHLHMKREKICSSGLWKAKKNYILHVWDNEGVRYSEPKIKISGIEAVKTSTPAVCREKIKKAIEYIMSATEDDIIKYIKEFKQEFFSLIPEEVSFPRRVSDIDKWRHPINLYSKGTPIHVRASLLYNNLLENKNLTNKYPVIKNGESIKFCYLREPNPIKENVIGYVQTLPKEFGLHQYVDYQEQFELTFIKPLTNILDVIGWKTEKMPTLDDLF